MKRIGSPLIFKDKKEKLNMTKQRDTSWNNSAAWYDDLLEKGNNYQSDLILPNLLRLLEIKKGVKVLDLGCGTGYFSRRFFAKGASVVGVDLGKDLIEVAKKRSDKGIEYHVGSADDLKFLTDRSFDVVVIVLALQNMENSLKVLQECSRVLKEGGKVFLVLNHPAFRVVKSSSWGWDEKNKIQYRRIDTYLTSAKEKMQMHPGDDPSVYTWTFHRSLQDYFKMFVKNNFVVTRLEEWISPKHTPTGPRAAAENLARKEIPLFLFLELRKINS